MTEVRIGIVGMGVQGSLYANILTGASIPYMPPIKKPEGCVLTAVSSRSEQAKEFASHILCGEPLFASMEDGLHEVQLANSIQLSGWSGMPVANPSSPEEYNGWLEKMIQKES